MMRFGEEVPGDYEQITALLDLAFGGTDESRLVAGLRAEGAVILALVADLNGRIVGHILFSELPIETDGGTLRAAALAPLAVVPERQRQGIGTALLASPAPRRQPRLCLGALFGG